jgi:hypothetical protein
VVTVKEPMVKTVQKRKSSFAQQLRWVNQDARKLAKAKAFFDLRIERLREVCPHLSIAFTEIGGPHTRICQHCGIQEVEWPSAFTTLTAPGGTWYETQNDKSKLRRTGQAPVMFPMAPHEAYAFRRGLHCDVSK